MSTLSAEDQALLACVSDDKPCGDNLEDAHDFVMLQAAVMPAEQVEYGDFTETPAAPDWQMIETQCRDLLARTHDVRLLLILIRCRVQRHGAVGWHTGLQLLMAMCASFGTLLHPQDDQVMQANTLATLVSHAGLLQDVGNVVVTTCAGTSWRIRDMRNALQQPQTPEAEEVRCMLAALHAGHDDTIMALSATLAMLPGLQENISQLAGEYAPDLAPVRDMLRIFAPDNAGPETTHVQVAATATEKGTPRQETSVASQQVPVSREEALQMIRVARRWFEQQEPSSPVPVLLHQAEKMVGKGYAELAGAIPVALLQQWGHA